MKHALVTLAAVVLAYGALDDITTDTATTGFLVERVMLVVCAGWFLTLAWRLREQGRLVLSTLSFAMLLLAVIAQPWIGTKTAPGFMAAYIAAIAGLAWFVVVAGLLAASAFRASDRRHLA